jgi:head-tail adaptor
MSVGLTPWEIHTARETSDAFLPGTAIIQTKTKTSDGQGGETWAYAASGTVDARLAAENTQPRSGEIASRSATATSWVLTIPAATTITNTDRVVFDSITYEVLSIMTRTPEEIARRVRLALLK